MSERYDAIIIGAGQAGPPLAVRLANAGRKTAIVERKHLGGTCVNNGCIPTKTLIASARVAWLARRASDFGITIGGDIKADMARVKARKDQVVQHSIDNLGKWLRDTPNLTLIDGQARFEDARTVAVGDRRLEAEQIFINVGARAMVPPISGLADTGYLTNASMMDIDFLPPHLIIAGGSYLGLEFAQMYRRFGSEVTVIEASPRLISKEDENVSAQVQAILENEDIRFELGGRIAGVARQNGQLVVTVNRDAGSHEITGSHLLLATGRQPNTTDLGLDKAGVKTDKRGYIPVDSQLRTNVPSIWALGEVNGRGAFTHTSYNDYEIVAANLLDQESRSVDERILAYAMYIDPPLGRIGMTEHEVRASGRKALAATLPMKRVGRARERSETQGFMSVLVDAQSRKILGATILGIEGDEVIHSILDVMYADAPYTVIERAMHIHPTVSELTPTLMGKLKPLD